MKTLFAIIFASLNFICSAQNDLPNSAFSTFQLGILGGINFSPLVGSTILIDGTTNLSSQLNMTLSLGYSTINKEEGYIVKTFQYSDFFNIYMTDTYNVDEINYTVVPISLGLEYVLSNDRISPYFLINIGYNFYSFKTTKSFPKFTGGGYYDTYDEIPSEFKNEPHKISEDDSYLIALGLGLVYKLSAKFNLDIRYLYQFNTSLVNTNQILLGISI
jgi:hypothetical protein